MVINSQRQNAGAAQVKPAALKRSLHVELVLPPSHSLSLFHSPSRSVTVKFSWSGLNFMCIYFFCQHFSISYYLFSLLSQALLFLSLAFAWLFQYYCSAKRRFETFCCQFDGDEHLKRIFQLANLLHSRLKPNLDFSSWSSACNCQLMLFVCFFCWEP